VLSVSLVWFFCLGGLGLFFPFYSLYLSENAGLTGSEVGAVLATLPLVGMLAQPLWGNVADRSGSRARILAALALGSSAGFSCLALGHGFLSLLLLTALLACFWSPVIPSTIAVTLGVTRDMSRHAFGFARMWGTIGFLIVVVSFPTLLDLFQARRGLAPSPDGPSEPGLQIMFPVTAGLVLLGALAALTIRGGESLATRAPRGDWRRLLRHRPYLQLLAFTLLAFLLLQGPMTFFPIYVRAHGGTLDSVSRMWILMVLLEIPLIALSGASLERLGARGLLTLGVIAGGVRWTVCGLAPESAWVVPVQVLHGVTVAGLVIGAPLYVEAAVPERLRSTGQGVLAMVGVSAGGITSNLSTGWLIEHVGPDAPYVAGGLGSLALAAMLPLLLPAPRRPGDAANTAPEGRDGNDAGPG
jgi:PPP family 3-phenylpropionic acid transporter